MIKITSLIDNISDIDGLHSEHGLSLYIQYENNNYLLDTGGTNSFIKNASKLDIDLKNLDAIIISHNHSDHIGGLPELLEYNQNVKVYIKEGAKSQFYYKFGLIKKYIGEPNGLFSKYSDRIEFFKDSISINNLKLFSNLVRDEKFVCKDKNLYEKKDGVFIPDKFNHELFVVLENNEELVVISSCSHNGIVNIINTVGEKYPKKQISHIIGGFHLMGFGLNPLNCTLEYVEQVAQILDNLCTHKIYTCHCTGTKAFQIMQEAIGSKISYLKTGESVVI